MSALGNGRNRFSAELNAGPSSRNDRNPRHDSPRQAASTVRAITGGSRTRFAIARSNRDLHHQRLARGIRERKLPGERTKAEWPCGPLDDGSASFTTWNTLPRQLRQTKLQNEFLSRRSRLWRAAYSEPDRFALPSVSGSSPRSLRQAPRFWAARVVPREPRDPGLPFRLSPKHSNERRRKDMKNPSGAWLGRGPKSSDGRYRLRDSAPMSRAGAGQWQAAIRARGWISISVSHCSTHVRSRTRCPRGRGFYARRFPLSSADDRAMRDSSACGTNATRGTDATRRIEPRASPSRARHRAGHAWRSRRSAPPRATIPHRATRSARGPPRSPCAWRSPRSPC